MPPKKGKDAGGAAKGGKGGKGGKEEASSSKGKSSGGQSINVRHILCAKHGEAVKAIERLQSGEKFNVVAGEMSTDKARSGGSLGWKTKGSLLPEFERVAFELPVSSTDKPVFNTEPLKTSEGYHGERCSIVNAGWTC